jgi:hypothetical protein
LKKKGGRSVAEALRHRLRLKKKTEVEGFEIEIEVAFGTWG